ncbi:MAG: hypothetical protein E3J72_21640 [Planctomycetota bacterium]|nr:MAG: hypothetical protein E3J72_21640 [Planctomycetota bacterium]
MHSECPVSSSSMIPALLPGDRLQWVETSPADLRFGDIVLYLRGHVLVAHRFLFKRRKGGRTMLVCQGDALPYPDRPLAREALLGRCVAVSRGEKTWAVNRFSNITIAFLTMAKTLLRRLFTIVRSRREPDANPS